MAAPQLNCSKTTVLESVLLDSVVALLAPVKTDACYDARPAQGEIAITGTDDRTENEDKLSEHRKK